MVSDHKNVNIVYKSTMKPTMTVAKIELDPFGEIKIRNKKE